MTKTETQSKNALINLVTSLLPGKHNTIPISTLVLWALDRDYEAAAMFTQCMYWKDRTDDDEGWFYKSYEDWYDEILIAEACARRKVKKLESMGWIQTMVWQVHRTPKLHYRVLMEQVVLDLTEAAESFSEHKETRQKKKEVDLAKRRERNREKRAETVGNNGYLQNGGNVYLQDGGITTTKMAGSIDTKTTSINYISETTEYIKSISGESADSTFELTGNLSNKGGSKTIDSTSSGTASPGNNPDSCGASENDSHSQNEPYAKPWHKDEPLRVDKDGYAVLPPANKHKMPRQTAVKLAQYVLLAENDPSFELMLPDPSDCLDDEYPTDCWVTSKNNCTWYRESELETTEPLRALRNVNEANGGIDFNELLNDCWRAATSLWDEDDALALFKRTPLPVIFEDFLEDYGVEVIDYDFDTLCPL